MMPFTTWKANKWRDWCMQQTHQTWKNMREVPTTWGAMHDGTANAEAGTFSHAGQRSIYKIMRVQWPLLLKVKPPKQGRNSNQIKGNFASRESERARESYSTHYQFSYLNWALRSRDHKIAKKYLLSCLLVYWLTHSLISQPINQSINQSINQPTIHPSIHPYIHPSIHQV